MTLKNLLFKESQWNLARWWIGSMSTILNNVGQGQGQICQDKKFSKIFNKLLRMVSRWTSEQNISVGCPSDVFFIFKFPNNGYIWHFVTCRLKQFLGWTGHSFVSKMWQYTAKSRPTKSYVWLRDCMPSSRSNEGQR